MEFTKLHQTIRDGCSETKTETIVEEVELREEHEGIFWVWKKKVDKLFCPVNHRKKKLDKAEVFKDCFHRRECDGAIATNAHIMKIVNNLPRGQVHSTKGGHCRLVEFGGFRDTGKVMEAADAVASSSAGAEFWELVGDKRSKQGMFVGEYKAAMEALAQVTVDGQDCSESEPLSAGDTAIVHGLQTALQHNGKRATMLEEESDQWLVEMEDGTKLKIKPLNLRKAPIFVRKYTESNVAALRELGKMFSHMREDVETTVGHKFKLGHLILTDTRKASQDSVIMHCDTDHDGRIGVQFMSPGGWRELSIGMAYIDRREGRRGYRMMDGRQPTHMERVRFTHGQSHWAMSGMLAGCEDMPNPGPNGEETLRAHREVWLRPADGG